MESAGPADDTQEKFRTWCRAQHFDWLRVGIFFENNLTADRDETELRMRCRFFHDALEELGECPRTSVPSDQSSKEELAYATGLLREQHRRYWRDANEAAVAIVKKMRADHI